MADRGPPTDAGPDISKSPPPAYSEVSSYPMNAQGGPGPMAYPPPPPPDQGYPMQPPYGQPYMQVPPPDANKSQGPEGPYPPSGQHYPPPGPYPPPGAYPPQAGQYPPAQYPPGPPMYPPGQPFPPGAYSHVPYTQVPYGHPTSTVVVTQPSGTTLVVAQSPPPDNMILSWMACLFCFCPLGFFAVIYSWQAKCANETNDFQAAAKYGSKAKRLAITSIIFGIFIFIICIILRLIVYTSNATATY